VQVNHLPYMPFPPNWPTYIPKDKLANWFETYVEAWSSTTGPAPNSRRRYDEARKGAGR
jgi:hypothetical protein